MTDALDSLGACPIAPEAPVSGRQANGRQNALFPIGAFRDGRRVPGGCRAELARENPSTEYRTCGRSFSLVAFVRVWSRHGDGGGDRDYREAPIFLFPRC